MGGEISQVVVVALRAALGTSPCPAFCHWGSGKCWLQRPLVALHEDLRRKCRAREANESKHERKQYHFRR